MLATAGGPLHRVTAREIVKDGSKCPSFKNEQKNYQFASQTKSCIHQTPCTYLIICKYFMTNRHVKGLYFVLTYLSSSSPVGHKATTMLRHNVLSFAEAWASPQDSPISFSSAITDCRHVIFGRPRFLFPGGVHLSATLGCCLGAFAEHALAILVVCV